MRVGRVLEKLDYFWFEEPLHDYEISTVTCAWPRHWTSPSPGWRWAAGHAISAAEYIVRGAVDIVRSDVSWKGGITGDLKMAHLCEAFGINCEIHLAIHSMLNLANLHAACGVRNCRFLELTVPIDNFGMTPGMALDSDGCVRAPSAPGLGVKMDWASIEPRIIARIDVA